MVLLYLVFGDFQNLNRLYLKRVKGLNKSFCWFTRMSQIKIFIRATRISGQVTSLHYSYDYHYYMEKNFRGNYHWLRDQGFSKGKIVEPKSAPLLAAIDKIIRAGQNKVRIYDLNTIKGRLVGFRYWIWKSPFVLMDHQRVSGLAACQQALSAVIQGDQTD